MGEVSSLRKRIYFYGGITMNIYEKLLAIQCELKAPKSQYNSFGKYNYRNCEDILEAVKPICRKHNAVLRLTDDIMFVEGRHYVKATAILTDCEKPDMQVSVSANAREEEDKKGMDGSQVTGASSSYARKYALNGLFDIDDTKDSDTTNQGDNSDKKPQTTHTSHDSNKPKNIQTKEEKPVTTQNAQYNDMSLEEAKKVCFANGNSANVPFGQLRDDQLIWISEKSKGKWQQAAEIILKARKSQKEYLEEGKKEDNEFPF